MKFSFSIDDIKYIKIKYQDNDNNICESKALVKYLNNVNIIAITKSEKEIYIKTPQEIELSIICNDGLYKTKSNLITTSHDEEYMFFTIALPQGCEYEQHREYFRVPVAFPCEYTIKNKTYKSETVDISASGVKIYSPVENEPDLYSDITIYVNNKPISITAKFIRKEQIEFGYRLAFHFDSIKESDRDIIAQACIQRQLELKRNHTSL